MNVIVRAALAYVLVTLLARLSGRGPGGPRGVPAAVASSSEWLVLALGGGIVLTGLWGGRSSLVELALGVATVLCLHRLHARLAQRSRHRDARRRLKSARDDARVRAARWN